MGKKLTDEFLKWTLDIDGKPAMAALNGMEQKTKLLGKANLGLYNEMVKLEAQGKKNSDEYKQLDKQYQENNNTISQSRARMADLRKEIGLNGLSATQLKQRMMELRRATDSSTPNTDAWKQHKKELSEVTARYNQVKSGATTTQVIFGKLGVAVGGMSGPIAGAINGIAGMGKAMWALVANPVGATIAAIVGALTLLYKAFTKTDTGAVAMAGALKAVGNVMDILLDRSMNMFKTLWSLITFDWVGLMKNGQAAFGGIGKALGGVITAGSDYAKMMDDIDDREVAAANRMTKLRVEIETLKNKAAAETGKKKLDMLQQAMDKEIELNGIEKGFLKERNDVETMNLASKMQNDKLTQAQKEEQLKQWLAVDDKELESLKQKDSAFAEFMDKNEGEFQKLQKSKADELDKEAELQTGTRRLQKGLATERKAENDKAIQDAKDALEKKLKAVEANNSMEVAEINLKHLKGKSSEDQYNADLLQQELKFYQDRMNLYKVGSKEYEEAHVLFLTKQVEAEKLVKDLLLKAENELTGTRIDNMKTGAVQEKATEEQRWKEELAGLEKQIIDKNDLSEEEYTLNDIYYSIIEEKKKAHVKKMAGITTADINEKRITELNDKILHATTQKQKWEDELKLAKEQYDLEFKAAEGNRQKELDAEEKYKNKVTSIREQQNQVYKMLSESLVGFVSDAFAGQLDQYASFGESLVLMALQILKQLIPIWAAEIVAGSLATPASIMTGGISGIVQFTALLAIMEGFVAAAEAGVKGNINSKKEKAQAGKGKLSGGYADISSSDSDPVGVYHANEFIASAPAVRNPTVKPILDIIDIAQRTGTIKQLNLQSIIFGKGKQVGGYANSGSSSTSHLSNSITSGDELLSALKKLNVHLDKGIKAKSVINKYGTNSLSEAMDEIAKFRAKIYRK